MWDKSANDEAIEAWNGVLFEKFTRFRHILTNGLAEHGAALLDAHPPPRGGRVLDIGCGFGDTTIAIARQLGPAGSAHGVDAAPRFIEVAKREAAEAGIANATFEVADPQNAPPGGPYDHAFSRMGVMFFSSPVAALRNIRRSLRSGAKLTAVVWRRREDNPWLYDAQQAVEAIVPHPETTDQPTCGPGPFSMAGADTVSAQLLAAGFLRPTFERHEHEIRIGDDIDEAIEFATALGQAGELLRLAGADAEKYRPAVIAALREVMQPHARPEGVFAESSTWMISAIAP